MTQHQPQAQPRPAASLGRIRLIYGLTGAILGIVILHPMSMFVHWLEHLSVQPDASLTQFAHSRIVASLEHPMLAMTAMFAVLGIGIGQLFAVLQSKLIGSRLLISHLHAEFSRSIPTLMTQGESATLEFKSTIRWDLRKEAPNKALCRVVVKTVAGFANTSGGDLLIGVDDDGGVVGLELDYATLKSKDRDGFELFVHNLIKDRLGGDVCAHVHVVFAEVDGHDVARVLVEPAQQPVYLTDGGQQKFYVRTGNSTRELDVKEAVGHITTRWR